MWRPFLYRPNDLPQPSPPGSQALAKAGSNESHQPAQNRRASGCRLEQSRLAAGNYCFGWGYSRWFPTCLRTSSRRPS